MHKIKKDDMVKIIAGKDKDKTGKVLSVDTKKNEVVVEGCNMVTKHTKPSQTNQNGGIVHQEAPINISNVMLQELASKLKTVRKSALPGQPVK